MAKNLTIKPINSEIYSVIFFFFFFKNGFIDYWLKG